MLRLFTRPLTLLIPALVSCVFLLCPTTSQATIRYVKPTAAGAGNGSSWADASADLKAMITASTTGDEVWVAAGTYKPTATTDRSISFALKNGVGVYGGFAGSESARAQRNWTTHVTTLSGDLLGDDNDALSTTFIGNGDNSYHVISNVNALNSTAVLDGFTIRNGNADGGGGSDPMGGGIFLVGCSPTLTNLVFTRNKATNQGGGFFCLGGSPVVTNATFHQNGAGSGAFVTDGTGGGAFCSGSSASLRNSVFTQNNSGFGGGLAITGAGTVSLENVGFSLNGALQKGGGIDIVNANPVLTNVTLYQNFAGTSLGSALGSGGGISLQNSNPQIRNSILWANEGYTIVPNGGQIFLTSSTPTYTTTVVHGTNLGAGVFNGTTDPLLSPDLRLGPGSPAINAGTNGLGALSTDPAGNPRVIAGTVDLGAYEYLPVINLYANGPTTFPSCQQPATSLYVTGRGFGMSLSGTNGNYLLTPNIETSFPSTSMTVELWFKANAAGVIATQLGQGTVNTGWNASLLEIQPNGEVLARMYPLASLSLGTASFGTWNHVAIRYNSATSTLDGLLNAVPSATTVVGARDVPTPDNHLVFGAEQNYNLGTGTPFNGLMDEIRIWNTARTNTEIANTFCSRVASNATGLVATYSLEGAGTDATANGYHATVTQANPWVSFSDARVIVGTLAWSNSATTGTIAPNASGTYTATVTESNGTTASQSLALTAIDPAIVADGPLAVCGPINRVLSASTGENSLSLNGTNQYLITPDLTTSLPTATMTLELWFKANAAGVIATQLGTNAINTIWHASLLEVMANGDVRARMWDLTPAVELGTVAFGTWNHVAIRYNANTNTLDGLLNGVASAATVTGVRQMPSPGNHIAIGAEDGTNLGSGAYFNGQIDEVRIWHTARSNAQVAQNRLRTIDANSPFLVAYYKLDETSGSTVADASPNGNHATVAGSPTWNVPTTSPLIGTVLWSTTATTPSITATTAGPYSVTVTKNGCAFTPPAVTITTAAPTRLYVNASATGFSDGLTWNSAFTDLQSALNYTCSASVAEIWVAAGTYKPTATTDRNAAFVMKNGLGIYGGFAGGETALSQRNWVTNVTTLSGEIGAAGIGDNSYHIINNTFTVGSPMTSSAVLDGFTIRDGKADGGLELNLGAGMFNKYASPTVANCTFTANAANNGGAGMSNTNSSPVVTNCTFSANIGGNVGGAMFNTNPSSPAITNCLFIGNTANNGGGMFNSSSVSATITNCTFSGNSAGSGGGIYNNSSTPIITNCIFWGNSSEIFNSGSTPVVSYSTVQGGYAGTGNSSADPKFISQPTVGLGTAGDLRVSSCSPALNAGTNSGVTATTDFAGNPRIFNITIDMGAYEFQALPAAVSISGATSACEGASITLTANPTISGTLSWLHNGSGATSVSVTGTAGVSNFAVGLVTNDGCSVTSAAYPVTFQPAPARLYVKANAVGTNDGLSWTNGFTDLQSALNFTCSANLTEVWVTSGTYKPTATTDRSISFSLKNGVGIYGGFNGTETALSQRNWLTNVTTLSGDLQGNDGPGLANNGENSFKVVSNSGINSTAILDGFTISGGNNGGNGGGMSNSGSSPTLNNLIFTNNRASQYGGGMDNDASSPTMTNVTFIGNSASTGGGMSNRSGANPVLNNAVFSGNTGGSNGGAIYNEFAACTLNNATICANSATQGGSMANAGGSPSLRNCIIWGNSSGVRNVSASPSYTNSVVQGDFLGTGIYDGNTDPLFVNLPAPGLTRTGDLRLKGCSPYLNAGNNSFATATTDVLNNPRIFGGTVDLGAYELQIAQEPSPGVTISAGAGYCAGDPLTANPTPSGSLLWSTTATTPTIPAIPGNTYTVTLTTPGGCTATSASLTVNPQTVTVGISGGPAFCGTVGTLTATPSQSGNLLWSDLATSTSITPVNGVTYTVALTTPGGCTATSAPVTVVVQTPVTTLYVDDTAPGANTGQSWNDAFTDLQSALRYTCPVSEIWVAAGTYKPTTTTDRAIAFVMLPNVGIYGGFAGGETALSQRNWLSNVTTLSGDIGTPVDNSDNSNNVIRNDLNGLTSTAIIDGFTITGGNANSSSVWGGGMFNQASSPTIANCIFISNTVTLNGGAIFNNMGSSPIITNCSFIGNRCTVGSGGGIYNQVSSPVLTNCVFLGNLTAGNGGAIANISDCNIILVNCAISGNSGGSAGAMRNVNSNPVFTNCILWGNNSGVLNTTGASVPVYTNTVVQGMNLGTGIFDGTIDPLFVSQPPIGLGTTGDLRLQLCSPLINAGTSTGVTATIDRSGNPRTVGSAPDLGAYEFQKSVVAHAATSTSLSANTECTDGNGWTHYYTEDVTTATVLLSIRKNGNPIGTLGDGTFAVTSHTTPNWGTNTATAITAPYVTNPSGWKVMNRWWNVTPNPQPATDVQVRSYYTAQDLADLNGSLASAITNEQVKFYKVNGSGDPNPANGHSSIGVAAGYDQSGYWEYNNGPAASTHTWASGTYGNFFSAAYTVKSFSGGGGGGAPGGGNSNSAFPVEWLSFEATSQRSTVLLTWATASELNTSHFDVERSSDGTHFVGMGSQPAAGNSSAPQAYNFIDFQPIAGSNFYRIKAIDLDGQVTNSEVREVTFVASSLVRLYPNPASGLITIESPQPVRTVVVYDPTGREVLTATAPQVDLSELAPGVYTVMVQGDGWHSALPLVKE